MKIGDLVKSIPKGYLGIVVEPAPHGIWNQQGVKTTPQLWWIHWLHKGTLSLRPESQVEVINEGR